MNELERILIPWFDEIPKEILEGIGQYVVNARIEELEKLPIAPLATALCIKNERIAELKKGLK